MDDQKMFVQLRLRAIDGGSPHADNTLESAMTKEVFRTLERKISDALNELGDAGQAKAK